MGTNIRTELSPRNKYYISKERRLELVHFCRQYPEWVKLYSDVGSGLRSVSFDGIRFDGVSNPTEQTAELLLYLRSRMDMVEAAADLSDDAIGVYIFKGATEGKSFANLKMVYRIPCERDMYYDRLHRFFWNLSKLRE